MSGIFIGWAWQSPLWIPPGTSQVRPPSRATPSLAFLVPWVRLCLSLLSTPFIMLLHTGSLCFLSRGQGPLPLPLNCPFPGHLEHNGSPAEWVWGVGGEEDGRTSGNQKASLGGLLEGEKEAAFKC